MKKTFFKTLAISLALVLVIMGLNLNAYASITSTTKGTISASGIEPGVTVNAYKLTTVNYDYTADQPGETPYTWNDSVKTWLGTKTEYATYSDPEVFYKALKDNADLATKFYGDLASAIKVGDVSLTASKSKAVDGTATYPVPDTPTGSVTFTDCEMGTYLILIENGYKVYSPSVVNLTPEYKDNQWQLTTPVEVTIKSSNPNITKTVDDTQVSTKDTITYTIVSDKPEYRAGSVEKTYKISDEVKGGLSIVADSIKVYGVNGGTGTQLTNTAENTYYTLTPTGTSKFLVDFNYDKLTGYDSIKIEYKAKLAQGTTTVIGGTGNTNKATLTYSNNPYVESSEQTQETPDVKVYTYGAEISKVEKGTTTGLSGAEFTLSSGDTALYFVKTADGIYYQANSTDTGATTTLVTATGGKLNIYGLDVGTYSLKETKAPAGYNIAKDPKTITIEDTDKNGSLNGEAGTTGKVTVEFPNSKGFQLPTTGGMGTVVFVATGIVCVGLGIILIVIATKKRKASK